MVGAEGGGDSSSGELGYGIVMAGLREWRSPSGAGFADREARDGNAALKEKCGGGEYKAGHDVRLFGVKRAWCSRRMRYGRRQAPCHTSGSFFYHNGPT